MSSSPQSHLTSSFWRGTVGGVTSAIVLQPLDLLKSRQQCLCAAGSQDIRLRHVASTIIREEGVLSFWNGLSPSLIRVGIGVGLYFSTLDALLHVASITTTKMPPGFRPNASHSDTAPPISSASSNVSDAVKLGVIGALARGIAGTIMHPISVVKLRMESGAAHGYRGPFNALAKIARAEGLPGLYAGLSATLVRDVPFSAMYLVCYQQLFAFVNTIVTTDNPAKSLMTGLVAGLAATTVSHPFDVVKTRLQLLPSSYFVDKLSPTPPTRITMPSSTPTTTPTTTTPPPPPPRTTPPSSTPRPPTPTPTPPLAPIPTPPTPTPTPSTPTPTPTTPTPTPTPTSPTPPTTTTMSFSRDWGLFRNLRAIYTIDGAGALWRGLSIRALRRPLGSAVVWTVFETLATNENNHTNNNNNNNNNKRDVL